MYTTYVAFTNEIAEVRGVEIAVGHGSGHLADRGAAVSVSVDGLQHVVVVLIGMLVARGIARVVHARAQRLVVEVFILMIEPSVWPTSWHMTRFLHAGVLYVGVE